MAFPPADGRSGHDTALAMRLWPERRRLRIGRLEIDPVTLDEALDGITVLVNEARGGSVFTPNVDHVVLAQNDARLQEAYACVSLSLVDGMPVLWASRLLGASLPEKVSGSDLVGPLVARAAASGCTTPSMAVWRCERSPEISARTVSSVPLAASRNALWLERSGQGGLCIFDPFLQEISLQVKKAGTTYTFSWRANDADPWTPVCERTAVETPISVGLVFKTWGGVPLVQQETFNFDYFTLDTVPAAPPVLLLTSRDFSQDQAAIKVSGAAAFLSKPFEIHELIEVSQKLIDGAKA